MKESKIFSGQNLTEKVHYVYRVTIDGKYYIGKRSGFLNDLHTGRYKTSSKIIQEKLRNGSNFSKIKILQVFSSSKEALEFERKFLHRVNAKANPKFLNQSNGNGNYTLKQHTQKAKKKMSEITKERYDINTEDGRKNLENHSKIQRNLWDENTERGKKLREHLSEKGKEHFNPNTEQGRKRREHISNKRKEYFNPETEEGRKRRENLSKKNKEITKAQFDINTEEGRKRRENHSEFMKEHFNPETEQGRRNLEKRSQISKSIFDKNTEEGRKRRENHSEFMKENGKNIRQKGAETNLQKRKMLLFLES